MLIYFFKGERGSVGGRGQPGETGPKGAKVRGPLCGKTKLREDSNRRNIFLLNLCSWGVFTACPAKTLKAEYVILRRPFPGQFFFFLSGYSLLGQIRISKLNLLSVRV